MSLEENECKDLHGLARPRGGGTAGGTAGGANCWYCRGRTSQQWGANLQLPHPSFEASMQQEQGLHQSIGVKAPGNDGRVPPATSRRAAPSAAAHALLTVNSRLQNPPPPPPRRHPAKPPLRSSAAAAPGCSAPRPAAAAPAGGAAAGAGVAGQPAGLLSSTVRTPRHRSPQCVPIFPRPLTDCPSPA